MSNACWLRALVLSMAVLGILNSSAMAADRDAAKGGPAAGEAAKTKKLSGRLPAYYGAVVTDEQRQKVYAIQGEYGPKIADLRAQLAKLQQEQEEKIEKLLTPEQAAKIAKLKATAADNRKAAKSKTGAAEKPEAAAKAKEAKK